MLGGAFAEVGPASQASQDDVARRKAGEAAEQRQQEAAVRAPQVTQPAEPSDGDGAAAVAAAATRNAQEAVDNTAWPSSVPVAHQSPSESGDGCWVAIRRVPGSSSKDAIVLDESDDEEGHVGGGKGGGAGGGGAQAASRQLPPRGGRPGGSQTASAAPGRSQRPRHPQPAALALTPVSVGDGTAVRGQLMQQPSGAAGAAREPVERLGSVKPTKQSGGASMAHTGTFAERQGSGKDKGDEVLLTSVLAFYGNLRPKEVLLRIAKTKVTAEIYLKEEQRQGGPKKVAIRKDFSTEPSKFLYMHTPATSKSDSLVRIQGIECIVVCLRPEQRSRPQSLESYLRMDDAWFNGLMMAFKMSEYKKYKYAFNRMAKFWNSWRFTKDGVASQGANQQMNAHKRDTRWEKTTAGAHGSDDDFEKRDATTGGWLPKLTREEKNKFKQPSFFRLQSHPGAKRKEAPPRGGTSLYASRPRRRPRRASSTRQTSEEVVLSDDDKELGADADIFLTGASRTIHLRMPVVYPLDQLDCVMVEDSDLDCLEPGQFLNDTVIDYRIRRAMYDSGEDKKHSIYSFNSFFFKKLNRKGVIDPKEKHAGVRRWTSGVDIFAYSFLSIPIAHAQHWFEAIVCLPSQAGEEAKADGQAPERLRSCILLLDSMRDVSGSREWVGKAICEYLQCEWDLRKRGKGSPKPAELAAPATSGSGEPDAAAAGGGSGGGGNTAGPAAPSKEPTAGDVAAADVDSGEGALGAVPEGTADAGGGGNGAERSEIVAAAAAEPEATFGPKIFDKRTMPLVLPRVPQQNNYHDCGLFVCEFACSFIREVAKHGVEKVCTSVSKLRKHRVPSCMREDWFDGAKVQGSRTQFMEELKALDVEQNDAGVEEGDDAKGAEGDGGSSGEHAAEASDSECVMFPDQSAAAAVQPVAVTPPPPIDIIRATAEAKSRAAAENRKRAATFGQSGMDDENDDIDMGEPLALNGVSGTINKSLYFPASLPPSSIRPRADIFEQYRYAGDASGGGSGASGAKGWAAEAPVAASNPYEGINQEALGRNDASHGHCGFHCGVRSPHAELLGGYVPGHVPAPAAAPARPVDLVRVPNEQEQEEEEEEEEDGWDRRGSGTPARPRGVASSGQPKEVVELSDTDEGEAPGAQPKPMDIEVILEAAVDNDTAAKMGKARGNR